MKPVECENYLRCDASLCPLDPGLQESTWYPGESICNRSRYIDLQFIRIQKKIKKKTRYTEYFYTYAMLNKNMVIRGGIKGIDPDRDSAPQIESFQKKHRAYIKKDIPPAFKIHSEKKRGLHSGLF
jgi:hypothetical protein